MCDSKDTTAATSNQYINRVSNKVEETSSCPPSSWRIYTSSPPCLRERRGTARSHYDPATLHLYTRLQRPQPAVSFASPPMSMPAGTSLQSRRWDTATTLYTLYPNRSSRVATQSRLLASLHATFDGAPPERQRGYRGRVQQLSPSTGATQPP